VLIQTVWFKISEVRYAFDWFSNPPRYFSMFFNEIPHNTASRLAVPFPPAASRKIL
jgi:hypothetical protein